MRKVDLKGSNILGFKFVKSIPFNSVKMYLGDSEEAKTYCFFGLPNDVKKNDRVCKFNYAEVIHILYSKFDIYHLNKIYLVSKYLFGFMIHQILHESTFKKMEVNLLTMEWTLNKKDMDLLEKELFDTDNWDYDEFYKVVENMIEELPLLDKYVCISLKQNKLG